MKQGSITKAAAASAPSAAPHGRDHPGRVPGRQIAAPLAVGAIIVLALGLRPPIVSVGPVLPALIREFGLSHAVASLLTAIPDILMGVLAVPTPWLARRYGRDPVLIAALLLLCASTFARTFATSSAWLLLSTVGVG